MFKIFTQINILTQNTPYQLQIVAKYYLIKTIYHILNHKNPIMLSHKKARKQNSLRAKHTSILII